MIRPATPADARPGARIQVAPWQQASSSLFSEEQLPVVRVAQRTEFWRRFPSILAETEKEVIGFVDVGRAYHDEDADGELYAIYIPDHWGRGVGRALMEAGEARLRELGYKSTIGMAGPVVRYAKQL